MNETLVYIVNSAAWSAAGFLVGWVFAHGARDVHEIREAVVEDEHPTGTRRRSRHLPGMRWIGVFLVVMAVTMVTISAYAVWEQREINECQSRVNDRFAEAFDARNVATERDQDALVDLAQALVEPGGSSQADLNRYLKRIRDNQEKREQNPFPELPEDECR